MLPYFSYITLLSRSIPAVDNICTGSCCRQHARATFFMPMTWPEAPMVFCFLPTTVWWQANSNLDTDLQANRNELLNILINARHVLCRKAVCCCSWFLLLLLFFFHIAYLNVKVWVVLASMHQCATIIVTVNTRTVVSVAGIHHNVYTVFWDQTLRFFSNSPVSS